MSATNKQGKMAGYINYRMRVTLNDGRQMTGQMLAFDKHMNLVLADTEEFRRTKRKQSKPAAPGASSAAAQVIEQEEKRTLGLTIVRGAHIVSLSVESPPPADPSARLGKTTSAGIATTLTAGPGVARPAGRGAAAPISLAGPAAGRYRDEGNDNANDTSSKMAAFVKAINAKIRAHPVLNYVCSTHFWGPVSNFGIPVAAVMDTQKSPELISGPMTFALCVYSATFMRYALAVTPKNYLLFLCHFVNEGAQLTQGYRYLQWTQWGGREKAALAGAVTDFKEKAAQVEDKGKEMVGKK
ncbi:58aceebe-6cc3-4fda-bb7b-3f71687d942d [Thermothielavioides terrestris]|nr:58aceebe-6cc3-4fda-bb7b-3f71687d942d [Thermothielavioides terrestris]